MPASLISEYIVTDPSHGYAVESRAWRSYFSNTLCELTILALHDVPKPDEVSIEVEIVSFSYNPNGPLKITAESAKFGSIAIHFAEDQNLAPIVSLTPQF